MLRWQKILLGAVLLVVFSIVYSPHFTYPYPFHIDEWRHITDALKLAAGGLGNVHFNPEIGFQFLLAGLSKIFDLVLVYKFLPALWAVLSAGTLFYIAYKKTKGNFLVALMAVVFFASLKSNVNILGLWFFTPLTFSIPFIFWYFYLFTEGVERQNKRYILGSLGIMLFLLPIHAISVLFAAPVLFIYSLVNFSYFRREKIFWWFLLVPILGLIFYKYAVPGLAWSAVFSHLIKSLIFKQGWGVLEVNNSFFELYSLVGYLLASLGIYAVILKGWGKKLLPYLLWPIFTLLFILSYKLTGYSLLVPYQRNLYYFALALPLLSAIGFDFIYRRLLAKYRFEVTLLEQERFSGRWIIQLILIGAVIVGSFLFYFSLPINLQLYRLIDDHDYRALQYLAGQPKAKVLADDFVSTALFPMSGQEPIGTIYFYGDRKINQAFFDTDSCAQKNDIIVQNEVSYVIAKEPQGCGWTIIYNDQDIIYQIK
jgi:hypothetical protein